MKNNTPPLLINPYLNDEKRRVWIYEILRQFPGGLGFFFFGNDPRNEDENTTNGKEG